MEEVPKSPVAAGVEPAELEPAATVVAMREETCLANRSDYPTNTSAESAVEVPKLVTVEVVAVNSADVTNVEQVIFEPSGFVDPALVDLAVSALSSAVPYNVELVIEPLVVTEETAADVEVASAAENEAEIFKPQILQVVADCRQVPVMREEMGSEVFSISFSTSSNTSDDVAFGNTLDIPCGGSSAPKRKCDFEEEREQKSNHVVQL